MKKNIIKYTLLILGFFITGIIYLSTIGIETDKFNKIILDKVIKENSKLDIKLKKIKISLDPLNFKINLKTENTKIIYEKKKLEFEYLETKITPISLIKKKFISSNLKISTKSILVKDLGPFVRAVNNKPIFFLLERFIKSGYLIADLELNFDRNGKIKQDYKVNGLLKDGKIDLIRNNKFEKINFLFNISNNNYNFTDINFTTEKINFISDKLTVIKNKKNYIFDGIIKNKKSLLNEKFIKIIKLNYKKFNFENINFDSISKFSFKINNKLKFNDLILNSEIHINKAKYKKPDFIKKDFITFNDVIYIENHKIKVNYEKDSLRIKGAGKIKLKNKFDKIDYVITSAGSNFNIVSNIKLAELNIKNQKIIKDHFPYTNDKINLKNHIININYKNNNLLLKGSGKIKLEKEFNKIDYLITSNNSNFNLVSNIQLTELNIKNKKLTEKFFPKINKIINLKNHRININYKDNYLLLKGKGKIQLEKEFNQIEYSFSKIYNKYNFDTKLDLNETSFNIDFINFKKNNKLNAKLKIIGDYTENESLNLKEVSILGKENKITLKNLLLDRESRIIKVDKVDLDFFDTEDKKNKFTLLKKQKNNYELRGSIFNANSLISNLLKNNKRKKLEIFKKDLNLTLYLSDVYIDHKNMIRNLNGRVKLVNNKIFETHISAQFENNENLTFTINTSKDEKITTLFSSKAKPIVKRYTFIKGYEGGYLDFYSSKKNKISKSKLKLYDFKLQKLPVLTKILTLASLQGATDLLSGDGIRFNEFEMNFTNKDNLMTIEEIYAIGPAISILMDGYVEQDRLVSLRGTLVPATTLNKVIGSIPLIGKILVGSKTGEGVFGVSFKVKGPPKNLKTTVNPIKTLTPRFITRVMEKIKKN